MGMDVRGLFQCVAHRMVFGLVTRSLLPRRDTIPRKAWNLRCQAAWRELRPCPGISQLLRSCPCPLTWCQASICSAGDGIAKNRPKFGSHVQTSQWSLLRLSFEASLFFSASSVEGEHEIQWSLL